MTMQRAHALKFKGKYDAAGQPDRYFAFAPARDLDARDIANLTDDEYREITGGDKPLYAEVKPLAEKKAEKPKAEEKKAEAPEETPKSPDAPSGK